MKNINKTAFAIGSSLITGLGASAALAAENPFSLSELSSGYLNLTEANTESTEMKMKDGACGEGKCGSKMAGSKEKAQEGKCGDKKTTDKKVTEGKCGEGKSGPAN